MSLFLLPLISLSSSITLYIYLTVHTVCLSVCLWHKFPYYYLLQMLMDVLVQLLIPSQDHLTEMLHGYIHPSIHPLCSLHLVWLMACGHACCHVLQVIRGSCSSVPWKLILFPYLLHSRYKTNPCRQQQCWVKLEMLCQRESKSKSKNGEVMLCGWWCREGTGGQGKSTPSVPKCRTFLTFIYILLSIPWTEWRLAALLFLFSITKNDPRVNLRRPNHACYTKIDNRSTQIGKTKQPATNFSIIFASK